MKMLTVHQPTEADREFFQWSVDRELVAIPGACPPGARNPMTLVVRDLDISEGDVVACCRYSFEMSGHDDDTFGEPLESIAREVATDAIEAAAKHPVGMLLRLVHGLVLDGRQAYFVGPADSCVR